MFDEVQEKAVNPEALGLNFSVLEFGNWDMGFRVWSIVGTGWGTSVRRGTAEGGRWPPSGIYIYLSIFLTFYLSNYLAIYLSIHIFSVSGVLH